ncbi:porin family protein [Albibacterium sp.]|uniref:porin family protein n=1 Tax=Albibacterium sp. TaxID=2952885 RepID=UPI002C3A84C5|nr:porin family protein [Albibacterium sp.]HUH19645.1 porin family protein [Albibacterium sp.]
MKKNLVTFVFTVGALIFSNQLSAQERPVSFGFKTATSLSNYRLGGDMQDFKSTMNIGGSVGGFLKYELSESFALQSGIDVYYKSSKLKSKTDNSFNKFKSFGVEIPVYGIFQGELGKGKAFIGAGPYVGYGISTKSDGKNMFKKNDGDLLMNRFDYGVGGIVGYDFGKNWQINVSYQFGLADLDKAKSGSMKSHGASFGIVYKF